MSGIFLSSTGGGLKNLARPLCPGTLTPMRQRLISLRLMKVSSASRTSFYFWLGIWLRQNFRILDIIEGFSDNSSPSRRHLSAFSALCPISMPHTDATFAMVNFTFRFTLGPITDLVRLRVGANLVLVPGSNLHAQYESVQMVTPSIQ